MRNFFLLLCVFNWHSVRKTTFPNYILPVVCDIVVRNINYCIFCVLISILHNIPVSVTQLVTKGNNKCVYALRPIPIAFGIWEYADLESRSDAVTKALKVNPLVLYYYWYKDSTHSKILYVVKPWLRSPTWATDWDMKFSMW